MDWMLDLLTLLGTTSNHSSTADLHTLQFTTASARHFPAGCVLNSCSLAAASNSWGSSPFRSQFLFSKLPMQNSCQFLQSLEFLPLLITFRHEPHRKHIFYCYSAKIRRLPLPRELVYRAVALAIAPVLLLCLPAVTKQRMTLLAIVA
jgi:hypothetical protein